MASSLPAKQNSNSNSENPISDAAQSELEDSGSHRLFCELNVLYENIEWKESARWLKFEEVVESGGRWSKPHVATLSLHSLFELRSAIQNAIVRLNQPAVDLNGIVDGLVEQAVLGGHLADTLRDQMARMLKLKHVHQHEKEFHKQLDVGERKHVPFVKSFSDLKRIATNQTNSLSNTAAATTTNNSVAASNASSLHKSDSKVKINANFYRKITAGTEGASILVGECDLLTQPFSAFVRLETAFLLENWFEVPVPIRFFIVFVGPKSRVPNKYFEIGRAISTLLSDELFQDWAFGLKSPDDLLKAIDDYIDQLIVLPPGEWSSDIRLKPPSQVQGKVRHIHI